MSVKVKELLSKSQNYFQDNPKRTQVIIISLIILGMFGYGARWFTSTPGFCSNCHQIYSAVDSWRRSVHSEVACNNCHATPGAIEAMKRIYLQFTVFNKPDNQPKAYVKVKKLVNESCGQCHSSKRTMAFSEGLNVPHEKHLEKGIMCTTCHLKVVHGEGGAKSRKPKMETCMKCHDGETAPESCGVCHLTIPEPTIEYYSPH